MPSDVAPLVRLIEPTPELRPAVLELAPNPDETMWSGVAADTLPAAEEDPTRFPVVIIHGDGAGVEPVGFFTIDTGPRSRRYAPPGAVGVQSFFIDHRFRRRGYARAALEALPAFVAEHHPWRKGIALTVNERNPAAIATYLAAGFVDRGERFLGGDHGPQHVLHR